jgi:mannose/cellobiose epimerase-like protein (N-acyl-D-glucosamine 2-epimerase family)
MNTHITRSDMRATGLDLNRTLRNKVQSTLNYYYKKEHAKYTQDELDSPVTHTKITNNYTAHAHDALLKRYGYDGKNQFGKMVKSTENILQPDGSTKQVVNLRITKFYRENSGELTEFYGYYTAYFHLRTYEQIQAGEPGIEFIGGSY